MASRSAPRVDPEAPALLDPQSLPEALVPVILQQAGLHTRQVCRAYRALHPPLLALAPDDLPTPAVLEAAVPTLPPTLTSLDLSAIQSTTMTAAALAAIPTALPHLQQLHLPSLPSSLLPALSATLHACPHLHTLLVFHCTRDDDSEPPSSPPWASLLQPPLLARLRSLFLPSNAFSTFLAAPPAALPCLTALSTTYFLARPLKATQLDTLAAAAPALQCLSLYLDSPLQDATPLAALTALTALTVFVFDFSHDERLDTLHQVSALTNLRSLALLLFHPPGPAPAESGWLARLTLLTQLHLDLTLPHGTSPYAARRFTAAVASAAAHQLPFLKTLRLSFPAAAGPLPPLAWLAGQPPDSFCRHLAAATQLQSLALTGFPLLPGEAHLLSSLQGLTALQLTDCFTTHLVSPLEREPPIHHPPLQWISALTRLQHVAWHAPREPRLAHLPVLHYEQVLATLPRLHTLDVRLPDRAVLHSPELAGLLAALAGRLERLRLCPKAPSFSQGTASPRPHIFDPPVPRDFLAGLTRLRVLDLTDIWDLVGLEPPLLLPVSLRRCYLGSGRGPQVAAGVLQQLRARHPLVAFHAKARVHDGVW